MRNDPTPDWADKQAEELLPCHIVCDPQQSVESNRHAISCPSKHRTSIAGALRREREIKMRSEKSIHSDFTILQTCNRCQLEKVLYEGTCETCWQDINYPEEVLRKERRGTFTSKKV